MKTTIEISTPLLRRAQKVAAKENTTLRALVEEGLAQSLAARAERTRPVYHPVVFHGGGGMNPEFQEGGWERIRHALYEGRGT